MRSSCVIRAIRYTLTNDSQTGEKLLVVHGSDCTRKQIEEAQMVTVTRKENSRQFRYRVDL